ncbi:hypothetical protein P0R31_33925 [Bradyrhizobium yuanmingense]|uniref:hypothetical protein n=1 Tax=Bradyrhizobium yuanmingense TaxID=108015 RepID=UPI0023B94DEC|nr:hypothetical protein [Bradyrhizobium yuanmingense]MDF0522242.1 hypothetical protein [Bradyrhizobium yuanmingense]
MTEKLIDIWAHALDRLLWCVPEKLRSAVIERLVQIDRIRPTYVAFKDIGEDDGGPSPHAMDEAASLMVQVLVRSITSENSEKDAAQVLFRRHHGGAGDGWLPSYLMYLPGLKVDMDACAKLVEKEGKSKLQD